MNDTAQTEKLTVILATPVLAKSHIRDEHRLNVAVVKIHKLSVSLTVKMEIQLLFIVVGEFRAEELIYKVLIVLCHFFGDCLRIILASTDIAHGETVQKTCDKTAAPESRIIYHAIKDIWLTGKADTHVRLFENNALSCGSVADIRFPVP